MSSRRESVGRPMELIPTHKTNALSWHAILLSSSSVSPSQMLAVWFIHLRICSIETLESNSNLAAMLNALALWVGIRPEAKND